MKKHSFVLKNTSYWSIFIFANIAFATSFAHVSADLTMDILIKNPDIIENSMLVKVGYLPKF